METFEAIIKRKGVRSFTDQKISNEQLRKLIHAANAAPISGGGFGDSARHLTVIQDAALLGRIAKAAGEMMGGGDPLYGAGTLIVLSAPENSFHAEQLDVGIMAQAILLAATDLGLNSIVLLSPIAALRANESLLEALALPQGYQAFVGVAVGHTDDKDVKIREYRDDNVTYF